MTQEAFQVGYLRGEGREGEGATTTKDILLGKGIKATDIKRPNLMNIHKKWFLKKFI